MIAFAWLIAMVAVGYLVERWAMAATTRFLRLAVDRGLIQPDYKGRYRSDTVVGFTIGIGEWFGHVRAITRTSTDEELERARTTALRRWVLFPIAVVGTGMITWWGLIALTRLTAS